ncbi:MAG: helix-turn-helix domain-containing protein [Bacteroidia bacterium]|nr:helix-turn-helix domain-containing protein [Bacteroidia bacterium]
MLIDGKELGKRLRFVRLSRGLSQEAVANDLGLTKATVSAIERGKTEPRIATIEKYTDYYGMSIPELFSLELTAVVPKRGDSQAPKPKTAHELGEELAQCQRMVGLLESQLRDKERIIQMYETGRR